MSATEAWLLLVAWIACVISCYYATYYGKPKRTPVFPPHVAERMKRKSRSRRKNEI